MGTVTPIPKTLTKSLNYPRIGIAAQRNDQPGPEVALVSGFNGLIQNFFKNTSTLLQLVNYYIAIN